MSVSSHFSADYAEARGIFRNAALAAGARLSAHVIPQLRGLAGEELATDIAVLGDAAAPHALLVISGTHGVEGFAGSGCQVGLLANGFAAAMAANTKLVLLHALNPHGFSWLRRVNEDGVDINRNFADFSALPSSAAYEELHPALVPARWDEAHRREADAFIAAYIAAHGARAYQSAVSAGQYTRPTGLFYGGTQPTWSARTLRRVLAEELGGAQRLAVLDIHTGLGPRGYGEPIGIGRSTEDRERALRFYGSDVRDIAGDESVSAVVGGSVADGVMDALPDTEITYVALEFGTHPIDVVLDALRRDHTVHACSERDPAALAAARRAGRDAAYIETSAWQAAVFGRTADFAYRALRVLGE
jgi:hypothetical protein